MNSAVCTLFEGDYHYGLGALVNSLYVKGFRGVVWAGYRGALPPWAQPLTQEAGFQEYQVSEGCAIRFVPVDTPIHFTNYKPTFMLHLWERLCPDVEAMFYFDPDIVLKCRWSFYEEWATRGIALCQEIVNSGMPADHPIRLAWKDYGEKLGYTCQRQLNQYFNAGFVGVHKNFQSVLTLWKEMIDSVKDIGVDIREFLAAEDRSSMILIADQDALNITVMHTPHPLSTIGPEGMGFVPGGFTMAHAVGSPKPWRKKAFTEALKGKAPSPATKAYWQYARAPIPLYSSRQLFWKRMDLQGASAVSRVVRRG